jgi:hypothetical protein
LKANNSLGESIHRLNDDIAEIMGKSNPLLSFDTQLTA